MTSPIFFAKFISADPVLGATVSLFKKTLKVPKNSTRVTLYISALGVFNAYLNGVRIGNDRMTPGWTNYKKRLQYFEYDLSELAGEENELVVSLGGGWYTGWYKDREYGDYPALIAAVKVDTPEGKSQITVTDETWQVSRSPVLSSSLYDGELIDARIVPNFNETAHVVDYDRSVLIPVEGERTKEHERISAKRLIITPKSEYVIDFGQEISGVFEFTLTDAPEGITVSIECAEVLDKDGNFYRDNYRSAKARIDYTTKKGNQSYKSEHTYFGFRYLRVSNWCGKDLTPECFDAIALYSDMKRTGHFVCGHEGINKLYSNVIWGQKSNFLDVPTDCPQRDEKLGWTGDAQVFARTASLNYDTERFFTKWLGDMMSEQHADGGIPYVIPDVEGYERSCSAAWSDAACIVPWEIYRAFGNKKLLRRHLPMMKKWVGYVLSRPGKRYLWESDEEKQFGDWLGLDSPEGSYTGKTDKALIAAAFFFYSASIVAAACRELGLKSEKYERLAENIKRTFKKTFIKRGHVTSDTQTAHVLILSFGLVKGDPVLKKRLENRLAELVEERGPALSTGFVGTPYLLDALSEAKRHDLAYKLLLRENFPSWLYSVKQGATTIWEHWDGIRENGEMWSTDMNSFNHYAYGAVASWLYGTVAGIKPLSPAYKTFSLSPVANRELGFVKASFISRFGEIASEWCYEGDTVKYVFTVPAGTSCEYMLPLGKCGTLTEGVHILYEKAID